jgi:glucarate dehydratase
MLTSRTAYTMNPAERDIEHRRTLAIERVTATAVSVPALRTCTWAFGRSYGHTRTIVQVFTRGGLVGIGEAPGDNAAPIIAGRFAPKLVGVSALEHQTVRAACLGLHRDFGYLADLPAAIAYSAVEIALWDVLGKHLGQPVFRVLGGAARERAPFGAYAYTAAVEEGHSTAEIPGLMAQIAVDAIRKSGAALFEFKVGRHPVSCDIETVHAIRAAVGPHIDLSCDANMAMPYDAARRFFDGVQSAKMADIEEPVATLAAMQRLRRDFGIPVSTHCTDTETLAAYPDIDNAVGDINVNGGFSGCLALAQIMRSHGRRFWLRSNGETGVGWAGLCHFGMTCAEADRPAQTLIDWIEDDLVEGTTWLVRDGGVRPPEKPGLGVELDDTALRHYAGLYASGKVFTRYDAP